MQNQLISELPNVVQIEEDYSVAFKNEDYIVLIAGVVYPNKNTEFDAPNLAARSNHIFECKTSYPNGRKQWRAYAGVDFYFVVPKNKITLIPEKGYSYVPIMIDGTKFVLNVSGGSHGKGWQDWVHTSAQLCGLKFTKKNLNLLNKVALSPEECNRRDIKPIIRTEERVKVLHDLIAAFVCKEQLNGGHKVALATGSRFSGIEQSEFPISYIDKKRRFCNVLIGSTYGKVRYTDIDWTKTAQLNDFAISVVSDINRLRAA